MVTTPSRLEKAICQKADAEFRRVVFEWDQAPIPRERDEKRQQNINRKADPGDVFITSRTIYIEHYLIPLIKKLINLELNLRIANNIPFTDERIEYLKEYFRSYVMEKWDYVTRRAYDDATSSTINSNNGKFLLSYQEEKLKNLLNDGLKTKPETLFNLIDTWLQEAAAEAAIHSEKQKNHPSPKEIKNESIPSWFSIAGVIFGAIAVLFLMALLLFSLYGREIPSTSRFIFVAFLALSFGLSSTFLGGTAAAKGAISLPFFKEEPMSFAVTGGIAVSVIIMILGYITYIR